MYIDIIFILQWWFYFLLLGFIFLPITMVFFPNFSDKGYIFSKVIGCLALSYIVLVLGLLKIAPFERITIITILILFTALHIFILYKYISIKTLLKNHWRIFLFEEILFLTALFFWSYIRAFQPDIHGLEKYMDFGFVNAILRSSYFPPPDMWFTPFSINYYYFGHLVTALLTKLSDISSVITYNLMLSTICAFTFTCSFSLGINFLQQLSQTISKRYIVSGGLLTAFLVTFAGNLHTIYTFFKPYANENPLPFWQLEPSLLTFPNSYWYPNATRFIPNTIHEFPIYSFVVSDLHGHVLDIPFVLLTIATIFSLLSNYRVIMEYARYIIIYLLFFGFLLASMYMTNAWDGIIYFLLACFALVYLQMQRMIQKNHVTLLPRFLSTYISNKKFLHNKLFDFSSNMIVSLVIIGVSFLIFSLPFSLHFTPFVSGIGIVCAPEFLTSIGKFGPFLFEADHCQKSPWWQILILYGFFYFWVFSFLFFVYKHLQRKNITLPISDTFVFILIFLSTLLIIIPEFIYAKDIYPAHYRANTMFKLVYQAFIMLSLSSGYIIIRIISNFTYQISHIKYLWIFVYWVIGSIGLFLIGIYPYYAITSYYGNLQIYRGLNGISYLKQLYPTDYEAILWLNSNISGTPVILEAQGDSYTDYARVSANTGLPTVLGWTVHEWLWRGSYDIPAPRIEEVKTLYETTDLEKTKTLIKKYTIAYVFLGDLERQKYQQLNEEKFAKLGKIIYQNGNTKIYQILP